MYAVPVLGDYAQRLVAEINPLFAYFFAHADERLSVSAHHPYHRAGPVEHLGAAVEARASEHGVCARPVHGQHFAAALEVIVRQHAAAYPRQRRVAAYEVVREHIHKVDELCKGAPVHMHGRVFAVDGYAVFVEVAVGRILPEPLFAVERDIYGAQRALVAHGATLVFAADGAPGIAARHRIAARRAPGVAEFRLCLVYGDYKSVFGKARIFVQPAALYVVVLYAVRIEPVGGVLRFAARKPPVEERAHALRGKGERTHHPVAVLLRLVGGKYARGDELPFQPFEQPVGALFAAYRAGKRIGGAAEHVQHGVPCRRLVLFCQPEVGARIAYELIYYST